MEKYLKLTSNEAIRHFILRDKTLAPEASTEIVHKLKDLDNLESELSVTIVLSTHRTKPDYEMDVIQLKNLVNEVEKSLYEKLDKKQAAVYMENIREAQNTIDYSLNLDSLVIYANEHFASVVKLPVELPVEIMIGRNFDLRPLYKTRQQNSRFYILTVSRNLIRLMEAFNDKIVHEINNSDFPFENRDYYTDDETKLMQDTFEENQYKEYFNDADKMFQKYYNDNPLPVILAGDIKTISYYEEQMDRECMVLGKVHGNYDKMPFHEIIKAVTPEIEKFREERQKEYLNQLDVAESGYLLSTDINEIYKASVEGAAGTLFVGNNFSLYGSIEDDTMSISNKQSGEVNTNDLLSLLIRVVRDNGGDTVFVEDDRMQKYNGIALIRRY